MVILRLVFPLGAALVFNLKSRKAQYLYRVLFVIPMVIPQIVTFLLVHVRNYGPINELLKAIGLGHMARPTGDFDFCAILFVGFPGLMPLTS